ncbi:MAG: tyrosine-type recombinase/integrase [Ktedonobacteraceae bacterium]
MRFFATILDILDAGVDGDPQKARAYGELLVERVNTEQELPDEERARLVAALRRVLDRDPGQKRVMIYPAVGGEEAQAVLAAPVSLSITHREGKPVGVQLPGYADQDAPFIQLWLRNQRAYKTVRAYAANIVRFYVDVEKPLPQVTLADLQDYAEELYDLAPASQASMLAAVKSCLTFCAQAGYLRANVGVALKLPRPEERRAERILSEAHVQRMLALENDKRNHAILMLLYGGALRVSELCGLRRRNLQPYGERGQITVYGKRSKTRSVPVLPSVWQEIDVLSTGFEPDAYVFQSRQRKNGRGEVTGGRLDQSQVDEIVKAAAIRAGVEVYERVIERGPRAGEQEVRSRVSPHWLRHASASHSIDRGESLPVVRDTLGQSSIAVTDVYSHARPGQGSTLRLPL